MPPAEAELATGPIDTPALMPNAEAQDASYVPTAEAISEQQNQQALAAELAQARQMLEGMSNELLAVDAELEDLATAREQHRLLLEVCGSLDKLGTLGGAALFWGDGTDQSASADYVHRARSRVDQFNERVQEIEARRARIIDRITQQQGHAAFMEDVLFEALEEEERRKQEWIIEREISALPARKSFMPWTHGHEDDKRFRKSVGTALLLCLIFALITPLIRLPERIVKPEIAVPDRIVRLLIESRPQPPPRTREQPKPKPQEKLAEQKPTKEPPKVAAAPDKETPEQAAPQAKEQGILAFR
jgi:chemotaxis protein histidine kinase CheA